MLSDQTVERNVALGKPAMQSSVSHYSDPRKPQGSNATSGIKTGGFGFHTELEPCPWWLLDLLDLYKIRSVVVYNREDAASDRAKTLTISLACDKAGPWVEIHCCADVFGGVRSNSPLVVTVDPPLTARFLRLHLNEENFLHLDEVEVYGTACVDSVTYTPDPIYASERATDNYPSAGGASQSWSDRWKWFLFGRRYNINNAQAIKNVPGGGQAVPDIIVRPGFEFKGEIKAIRLQRYGRFGNNFYQILNSSMLARVMNCKLLQIPEIDDAPDNFPIVIDDFVINSHAAETRADATLSGSFYWPTGMESVIDPYSTEFANETVERFVSPVYQKYFGQPDTLGDHTLVMHFRGGDIFMKGIQATWYVQPPASYYIKALKYTMRHLDVSAVHLVFEDKTNPSVDVVLDYLARNQITHSYQSSSLFEDISTIMNARHLVTGYGTFCEAIGLLSHHIKSYFAFRRVSSQRAIRFWAQSRVEDMLRAKGVKTVIIDDPDRSYIKEETWDNSPEQIELMRSYPIEKLHFLGEQ